MNIDLIKKQLIELIYDRKSFLLKDAEHDEIYLRDIDALEAAIKILDDYKTLKEET